MVDKSISMNLNEVLELEYLVEEFSSDVVNFNKNPNNDTGNYIARDNFVFDPTGTGVYELEINNQTIEIDVYDIPDSGGTHQWNFESGSGTTATDSIGSLDGSISGATWKSGEGAGDNYLSFDGEDDEVALSGGASSFTHFTDSITGTVFAWINVENTTERHTILGNSGTNEDVGMLIMVDNSNWFWEIYTGNKTNGLQSFTPTYGGPTNSWYPVAFTVDGSTAKIYEGESMTEIASQSTDTGSTTSNWTRDPSIGYDPSASTRGFFGNLDLVWTDNVARSQSDLQSFVNDSKGLYP